MSKSFDENIESIKKHFASLQEVANQIHSQAERLDGIKGRLGQYTTTLTESDNQVNVFIRALLDSLTETRIELKSCIDKSLISSGTSNSQVTELRQELDYKNSIIEEGRRTLKGYEDQMAELRQTLANASPLQDMTAIRQQLEACNQKIMEIQTSLDNDYNNRLQIIRQWGSILDQLEKDPELRELQRNFDTVRQISLYLLNSYQYIFNFVDVNPQGGNLTSALRAEISTFANTLLAYYIGLHNRGVPFIEQVDLAGQELCKRMNDLGIAWSTDVNAQWCKPWLGPNSPRIVAPVPVKGFIKTEFPTAGPSPIAQASEQRASSIITAPAVQEAQQAVGATLDTNLDTMDTMDVDVKRSPRFAPPTRTPSPFLTNDEVIGQIENVINQLREYEMLFIMDEDRTREERARFRELSKDILENLTEVGMENVFPKEKSDVQPAILALQLRIAFLKGDGVDGDEYDDVVPEDDNEDTNSVTMEDIYDNVDNESTLSSAPVSPIVYRPNILTYPPPTVDTQASPASPMSMASTLSTVPTPAESTASSSPLSDVDIPTVPQVEQLADRAIAAQRPGDASRWVNYRNQARRLLPRYINGRPRRMQKSEKDNILRNLKNLETQIYGQGNDVIVRVPPEGSKEELEYIITIIDRIIDKTMGGPQQGGGTVAVFRPHMFFC